MKALFLDESGDHNLINGDPNYPVFVLGGVIVDQDYAEAVIAPRLREFKRAIFGREDIVLHTADIVRQRAGFEALVDPMLRAHFYLELNRLMRELEYRVIACVIHKKAHIERYGPRAADPYLFAIEVVAERLCYETGYATGGSVMFAERRGVQLDRRLLEAWETLRSRGNEHLSGRDIAARIASLELRNKADNVAGLQLADLVVSPIGRRCAGKPTREDWDIVEAKLRRDGQGKYDGYGLVQLPRQR